MRRTDLDPSTVRVVDLTRWVGKIVRLTATVSIRYVWVASSSPDPVPDPSATQAAAPATGALSSSVMALLPGLTPLAEAVDSEAPFLAVLTDSDASGELYVHPW